MGTLFLVATPIGNLEDVTLRALRVLGEAELVLAEDTRHTRGLLDRHGIEARPLSLHAHNEASRVERVLAVLEAGGDVALVSDAGTPVVSDPGERLVREVAAAGHAVSPIPGPSAVLAAVAVSGLPASPFAFLGFPARRAGERRAALESWRGRSETLVLFESPRRVGSLLRELREVLGDRPACVTRELTKLHEEVARGSLSELATRFEDGVRGEVTVVVGGALEEERVDDATLDREIRALVAEGLSSREVAARLAKATGRRKSEIYARAVAARRS